MRKRMESSGGRTNVGGVAEHVASKPSQAPSWNESHLISIIIKVTFIRPVNQQHCTGSIMDIVCSQSVTYQLSFSGARKSGLLFHFMSLVNISIEAITTIASSRLLLIFQSHPGFELPRTLERGFAGTPDSLFPCFRFCFRPSVSLFVFLRTKFHSLF